MAQTSKDDLKKYFETGDKPTQTEYAELIDALRHVDEKLPIADVDSLQASLDSKATTGALLNHINDDTIHGVTLTGAEIKTTYEAEADTNAFTDIEKQHVADGAVHRSDDDSHVSAGDKTNWNNKLDAGVYLGSAQDLKNEIDTKVSFNGSGNPFKFFNELGNAVEVPVNSYATTIYIDSSIADSSESTLNEKSKPFKTMLDGKNALTGFESAIRYHFIDSAVHVGCELDQIDTEFNADTTATIDFTNVNVGGSVISDVNNPDFTPRFNFLNGRISIVSNSNGAISNHEHSFTPKWVVHGHEYHKYTVIIQGHINKFNWRAKAEVTGNVNLDSHTLATGTTNLEINEFVVNDFQTSSKILSISDNSNITIRKVTFSSSGTITMTKLYYSNTGAGIDFKIHHLDMSSGTISLSMRPELRSITGTGVVKTSSARFDDCSIDSTIDMNFVNVSFITGRITTSTPIRSSYAATTCTVQNFEGYLQNLDFHSINTNIGMIFKGNNKIYVAGTNKIASVNYIQDVHRLNVVQVLDGITVIEHNDPTATLFTGGGANKVLDIRSMLLTNCQNIGLPTNYFNNELRVYP